MCSYTYTLLVRNVLDEVTSVVSHLLGYGINTVNQRHLADKWCGVGVDAGTEAVLHQHTAETCR